MAKPTGYAHAATLATGDPDLAVRLAGQLREAQEAIQRVRALHVPEQMLIDVTFCVACSVAWPCQTIRALETPS